MASTSSRPNHSYRFDVFLSFRGEDTRNTFSDHLYEALVRAGITTFRDNEIDRGQELKPELDRAIIDSRASIIVMSESYAGSRWCLNELLLILEQRQNYGHFVLPVFYHVDPSHVRNHQQNFAIKADLGVEGSKWTEDNVKQWKEALTELSNLTGMVVSGLETDFIAKIVETIYAQLDLKLRSLPAHLTGMETRAKAINLWLKEEQSSIKVVAICGMGGSGKTTLAQYIYNSNKLGFDNSSWLEEIGKHSKETSGLLELQKQLLADISGGRKSTISNVSEGTRKIEDNLQMKKVFIVLDDIDDGDELAALLGTTTLHIESKIIITTRHLDIQNWFGSKSHTCYMYKLDLLNSNESLEILSCHAFGAKIPMNGFEDLASQLAQYCEGNPLALKVLGSSLFVSSEDSHKRNEMIEIWISTLNSLNSFKGDLDSKIDGILRKSYDSLPRDKDKELFLHIACFFVDEYGDFVVNLLEDEWQVKAGIMTLVKKSLVTVSPNNRLTVHQLLQEMGRNIVRKENKNPAKRSILWHDDDSYRVLKKGNGTDTTEGLSLDMRNLKIGTKPVFSTNSIAKMDELKFLKLRYVELSGSYEDFPELVWLSWHGFPLKTIPDGLLKDTLVAIDLGSSDLEKFEPPEVLDSVKILNLYGCSNLASIHNLNMLPKLESLILWNCTSLTHVCKTIGDLKGLGLLDLNGCNKLWNNENINQFSLPKSLQVLFLDYCNLNDIPVIFNGQSITDMSLAGNLFEYLPNNIDLKMLRVLNLSSCSNLKSILCLPSTVQDLHVNWCTSLEKITFESSRYTLQNFVYEGCLKLCEVQGLFKLVSVEKLDEEYLGNMKWIKTYQDCKVDLVGDEITKFRDWRIQMLYEYGIRSTFLPAGIKDESMTTSEYTSSTSFVSFDIPLCPNNRKIQGLNVSCQYRLKSENEPLRGLLIRIVNHTKDLAWVYNPVVYGKPVVDKDVVWLSYWPIGNTLDIGDKVYITVIEDDRMIVDGCSASLEYINDYEQEKCENYTKTEEVIGGDLAEFMVFTGRYYLCRRNLIKAMYLEVALKKMLGDNVEYTESQGWRKYRKSGQAQASMMEQKTLQGDLLKEIVLELRFNSEGEAQEITNIVSNFVGVEAVSCYIKSGRLIVKGVIDPVTLANRVREFDKTVEIKTVDYVY